MNKRPLIHATLRWFLLAMILANVASEMYFSFARLDGDRSPVQRRAQD